MTDATLQDPAPPPRSRWLPTIGLSLWLTFMLGLMLSQWRVVMINADGDACLHWRIGNWMIEHHAVIHTDLFSHTRANAPLISKEWLSEVLFAAAGDALGWNGIALLAAVLIATCLWLLLPPTSIRRNRPVARYRANVGGGDGRHRPLVGPTAFIYALVHRHLYRAVAAL